jgi:hypothetical protein
MPRKNLKIIEIKRENAIKEYTLGLKRDAQRPVTGKL